MTVTVAVRLLPCKMTTLMRQQCPPSGLLSVGVDHRRLAESENRDEQYFPFSLSTGVRITTSPDITTSTDITDTYDRYHMRKCPQLLTGDEGACGFADQNVTHVSFVVCTLAFAPASGRRFA